MKMKYLKNASLKYFPENCTSCGRCIEVCPHAVFKKIETKVVMKNPENCMECGACQKNCDFNAITVKSGVGCAFAVITGIINGTEPDCGCGSSGTSCC